MRLDDDRLALYYVLDAAGEPVRAPDFVTWALWFEAAKNRSLASTRVGRSTISTVFLGLDHAFGDGPPVLWETMIFGGHYDGETRRYTSRVEALAGHDALVAQARAIFAG